MSALSKALPMPPHEMISFIDGSEDVEELDCSNQEAEIMLSKPRRSSESSTQSTLPNSKACRVLGINTRSTFDEDSESDEDDQTDLSSLSTNHHGMTRVKSPSFMSTLSRKLHKKSPSIGFSSTSSHSRGASVDEQDGYRSSIDESSCSSMRSSEDSIWGERKNSFGELFRKNSNNRSKVSIQPPQRSSSIQNHVQQKIPSRKSYVIDTRAAISAGWMRGPANEWPYRPRKKVSRSKHLPSIIPPSYNPSKSLIPACSPALTAEFSDLYRDETDYEDEPEWALTVEDRSNLVEHRLIDDRSGDPNLIYEQLSKEVCQGQSRMKGTFKQHKRTFSTDDESNASSSSISSQFSKPNDFERFSSSGSSTSHTSGVPSLIGSSEKHESADSSSVWSCTTGRSSKMETIATPFHIRKSHPHSPPLFPPPKEALPAIPKGEEVGPSKKVLPPLRSTRRSNSKKGWEKINGRPPLVKSDQEQDIVKIRDENAHVPRIRGPVKDRKKDEDDVVHSEIASSNLPKFITTDNPRHGIIECNQEVEQSDDDSEHLMSAIPRPAPSPPDGSGPVLRTHQPATQKLPAIVTTRASTPSISVQANPIATEEEGKDLQHHKRKRDRMETLFSGTQDSPDERMPEERRAAFETAVRRLDGEIPDQAMPNDEYDMDIYNLNGGQRQERITAVQDKDGKQEITGEAGQHANDVPSPDMVARMVEQLLKEVPSSPVGKTTSQIIEEEKVANPKNDTYAQADSPSYEASISSAMTDSSLVPSYYLRSPSLPSSGEESGFVLTFEAEETPIEEEPEREAIEEKAEEEKKQDEEKKTGEEEEEEEEKRKEANSGEDHSNTDKESKAIHEQIHDFLQPNETPSIEFDEYEKERKLFSMISLKSPLIPEVEYISSPVSKNAKPTEGPIESQNQELMENEVKHSLSQRHGFSTPLHLIKDEITFDGDYDAPSLSNSSSSPTSSESSSNMEHIAEEDRAIRTMEDALDQILSDLPPMCLQTIEPLSPLRLLDGTIPSAPVTPKMDVCTPNTAHQQSFPRSPAPKALNVYKDEMQYSTSLSRPRPNKLINPTTPRSLFPRGPITPRSPMPKKEATMQFIESQTPTVNDTPMKLEMDFDASPMSMAAFIPSDSPFKKQDLIPSSPIPTPLPGWPETPMINENNEEQKRAGIQSPVPFLPQLSPFSERTVLPRSPLPNEIPLPKSPKAPAKMTLNSLKPRMQTSGSTLQVPCTARELPNHTSHFSSFTKDGIHSAPCSPPGASLSLRALRSTKPVQHHTDENKTEKTSTNRRLYLAASPSIHLQSSAKSSMFVPTGKLDPPAPITSSSPSGQIAKSTNSTASPRSPLPSSKPIRTPKSPKRKSNVQVSTPLTPQMNMMQTKRYVLPI